MSCLAWGEAAYTLGGSDSSRVPAGGPPSTGPPAGRTPWCLLSGSGLCVLLLCLLPRPSAAGLLRANLHVHTSAGVVGAQSPAQTLASARSLGLDLVALTDPAERLTPAGWAALSAAVADPPPGILALPGYEYSGSQGHLQVIDCDGFILAHGPTALSQAWVLPELDAFYVALLERVRPHSGSVPVVQFSSPTAGEDFDAFRPGPGAYRVRPFLQLAELATGDATAAQVRAGEALWRRALSRGWHVAPSLGAGNAAPLAAAARDCHTGVYVPGSLPVSATVALNALRTRRFFASQDGNAQLQLVVGGSFMGSEGVVVPAAASCEVRYADPDAGEDATTLQSVVLVVKGRELPLVASTPVGGTVGLPAVSGSLPASGGTVGLPAVSGTLPASGGTVGLPAVSGRPPASGGTVGLPAVSGTHPSAFALTPARALAFSTWSHTLNLPFGSGWVYARVQQADGDLLYTAPVWFEVPPYEALAHWGSYGGGADQFRYPKGLTVSRFGEVYVADTANSRLKKFSTSGRLIGTWGRLGSHRGELRYPRGLATDAAGLVYVADTYNHRVQKFTRQGACVASWGAFGSGPGQFRYPSGVAVDSAGSVYVADAGNDRIVKLGSNGAVVKQWGSTGAGAGQLRGPLGLTLNRDANLVVVDTGNRRLQVFDRDGEYLGRVGAYGLRDGDLGWPCGVATDAAGNTYVVDEEWRRVFVYNAAGRFRYGFGRRGRGEGFLSLPAGIAVGGDGRVYLADTDNSRVAVYAPVGAAPAPVARPPAPAITALAVVPAARGLTVTFALTAPATVTLSVSTIAGRPVRALVERTACRGTNTCRWDGRNSSAVPCPAGVYLLQVTARGEAGGQVTRLCRGLLRSE